LDQIRSDQALGLKERIDDDDGDDDEDAMREEKRHGERFPFVLYRENQASRELTWYCMASPCHDEEPSIATYKAKTTQNKTQRETHSNDDIEN